MISFLRRNINVLGPAAFTLALLLWTIVVRPEGHAGGWPAYPVFAGAPVVAGWHLWFVFNRPQRLAYLTYALANLVVYAQLAILAMAAISQRSM